jgi:hypothetical protein
MRGRLRLIVPSTVTYQDSIVSLPRCFKAKIVVDSTVGEHKPFGIGWLVQILGPIARLKMQPVL